MAKKLIYIIGGIFGSILLIIIISSSSNPAPVSQPSEANQESVASELDSTTGSKPVTTKEGNIAPKQVSSNAASTPLQYSYYSVVEVVDGDTIKINISGTKTTLRLIGIDTPETKDPRKPVQCFGQEASNKAKELLSSKKVRIEKDSTQGEIDKYGRMLAYVYRDDGLFYNKYMIEHGYAHEYTYNIPYKYQVEFKVAEKYARENQLGLWSPTTCNGDTTQAADSSSTSSNTSTTTQSSGKYYTSSYASSKYYYPENCDGWKSLSPSYLKEFNSLEDLLKAYPTKTLSPQCQ